MSKPLILTPAQAKDAYDAMCALNNVGGRIRATIPTDTPHGQIEVRENAVGEVFVEGFGCEIYADQAEFSTAYGLNADETTGALPMSTKSQELAAALVASLQEDLAAGGAVAGLVTLPMIRRAAELRDGLEARDHAMAADAKKQGGTA